MDLPDSWRGDHGGLDATFPCRLESRPEQRGKHALALHGCEKSSVHPYEIARRKRCAQIAFSEQNGCK